MKGTTCQLTCPEAHRPALSERSLLFLGVEGACGAEHGRGLEVSHDAQDGGDGLIAGLRAHRTGLDGGHHIRDLQRGRQHTVWCDVVSYGNTQDDAMQSCSHEKQN